MDSQQPNKRQLRLPYILVMTAMVALFFVGVRICQQMLGELFNPMTPAWAHLSEVLVVYLPLIVFATALFVGCGQSHRYTAVAFALGVILFWTAGLTGVSEVATWIFRHCGIQMCATIAAAAVVARSLWTNITIAWSVFGAGTFVLAGIQAYFMYATYAFISADAGIG